MGAHVGFDFHDAAGEQTEGGAVNQELAQQARSDEVGAVFEEGAREKFAGEGHRTGQMFAPDRRGDGRQSVCGETENGASEARRYPVGVRCFPTLATKQKLRKDGARVGRGWSGDEFAAFCNRYRETR